MGRRMLSVAGGVCVALLIVGCEDKNKKMATDESQASSDYGLDYMDSSASTSTTGSSYDTPSTTSDPYGYGASSSSDSSGSISDASYTSASYPSGGGRVHIVRKKETLSSIAYQYYGVRNWRKIYDANRDRISDPNVIHPGMELIIP